MARQEAKERMKKAKEAEEGEEEPEDETGRLLGPGRPLQTTLASGRGATLTTDHILGHDLSTAFWNIGCRDSKVYICMRMRIYYTSCSLHWYVLKFTYSCHKNFL